MMITISAKVNDETWGTPKFFNEMIYKTKLLKEDYTGAKAKAEEMLTMAGNEEEELLSQIDIVIAESKIAASDERGKGKEYNFDALTAKIDKLTAALTDGGRMVVETEDNLASLPKSFQLSQNYPNPFNPTTKIKFALPNVADVQVKIFNSKGSEVTTLVNGRKSAGYHSVGFNGSKFTSGIYFYSLEANGKKIGMKKMMLIK